MAEIGLFARQFGQLGQKLNRAAFETRFNAIQRGLLTRRNEEIREVSQDGTERKVAAVQKQRDALFDKVTRLQGVQDDFKTNALRFLDIRDTANVAVNSADADEDEVLTADEAEALNAAIATIKDEIYKLKLNNSIDGISDGFLANRMRQEEDTLSSLTAVAGAIDAAGADPQTNDNRQILDALESIVTKAGNYADSTTVLVEGINQFIIDGNKRAYDKEADLAALTAGELAEKEQEIADIENRYNNLIKAISLSFEANSGLGDFLSQGTEFTPPKGSILNMFT